MQTNVVSIRDNVRMIFRRKWALLLPIAMGIIIFFPLWAFTPDTFLSVATVRRQDMSATEASPAALVSRESPRLEVQSIRAEVLAYKNLEDVIKQTKQDVYLKTPAEWQAMYDKLRADIAVSALSQTHGVDFINFAVTYTDPDLAQKIASAVATSYVERTKSSQRTGGLAALDFLSEETERYRNLLRDTEKELDDYRAKYFADLPDVKNGIRSRLLSLRIAQDARGLEQKETQSRLAEAEVQLTVVKPSVRSETTTEPNPAVTDLKATVTQMERTLQMLLTTYKEAHPDVVRLRDEIAALKEQLAKEPERITVSEKEIVNPQYEELLTDISRLKQQIKGGEAALLQYTSEVTANENELADVVKQEKHYNDLLRNQSEYTEHYTQYRRQLDEAQRRAKVQEEEYVIKVELFAPPLKPATPDSTPVAKLALVCLVGGIAAGLSLMFGLEFCDHSFRSIDDAETFLKVPVLASLTAIVPPEEATARRRRRLVIGATVGAALLVMLIVFCVWLFVFRHTLADAVAHVRSLLLSAKAILTSKP